jgi:NAD(P)-dependent dehydrogenase (short-subunit alcohol dehydrogenase family)
VTQAAESPDGAGRTSGRPLVIGTDPARTLATWLGADWCPVPVMAFDEDWSAGPQVEEWRVRTAAGPATSAVVVAAWTENPRPSALVDTGLGSWLDTMEAPFARWFAALTAGAQRCADGGQVVGVVDRPSPKESAGWSSVSAVADAVEVMVHSLAEVHRPRGVRVNLITTPDRLEVGGSPRSRSVAGTVSMLLQGGPDGITSAVIPLGAGH